MKEGSQNVNCEIRLVSRWVLAVSFFQLFCKFDIFAAKYWLGWGVIFLIYGPG